MNFTNEMSTVLPTNTQQQNAKTIAYVQQRKGSNKVYVQGIVAVIVFVISLIVAIFIFVPYIQKTAEISKKVEAVESDITALEKKYKEINGYDRDELAAQLKLVSYYIPDTIRVANLATFINANATKYELAVARLGINEDVAEIKASVDEAEKSRLLGSLKSEKEIFLGRVEGPFSFSGSRDAIFDFLDFLVLGGYATNFDQVSIVGAGKDSWTVNFFAVYYYLEPLTEVEAGRQLVPIQKELISNLTIPVISTPSVTPSPSVSVTPTVSQ